MTDDDIAEGWYTDSEGAIRWWDGARWTEHVRNPTDETEQTAVLPADRSDAPTRRAEPADDDPDHRRRLWLVATVVGLLAFFLGMAIGSNGNSPSDPIVDEATASSGATSEDLDQREKDLKDREGELEAKQKDLEQRAADLESRENATPDPSSGTEDTIGNGVFEVGTDVEPGQYASEGPDDPQLPCTYKVSSDEAGDEIISSKITKGPGTVTLEDGQFFTSEFCKIWTPE
jgi:hypothetical protein